VFGSRKNSACPRFAVLAVALLAGMIAAAPAAADHPGQRVAGTLVTDHADDFRSGKPRPLFTLKTGRGERRLRFRGGVSRRRLHAASTVTVRGRSKGRSIRVQRLGRARPRVRARAAAYLGDRKTAIVLMSFATSPSSFTAAAAKLAVFDDAPGARSADAYYREVSDGDIALVGRDDPAGGDVYGPVTVAASPGCPDSAYLGWKDQAANAANLAGARLSEYDHVIYVLPPGSGCAWLGLASVGGRWSMMRNTLDTAVVAHELGHNLYLDHASSDSCEIGGAPVPIGGTCTNDEYGDPFDAMGNHPEGRLFSSSHRRDTGWVTGAQVQTPSADGTYQLGAAAKDEATRMLRIPRGNGTELNIELRRPFGTFDDFDPASAVTNGLSVRIATPLPALALTHLLDMKPETSTLNDSPLAVGKSFYDPVSAAAIRLDSLGPLGATVTVDLAVPPSPQPATSTTSSSPPTTASPAPVADPPRTTPASRLTFLPARVLALGGSRGRGSAGRLRRTDGRSYTLRARRGLARMEARFARVKSGTGRMKVTLRAKASTACRGRVEIYVPGARRWARAGRLSLRRGARTVVLSATGAGTRYVSSAGTVRVRLSCGARRLRSVTADLLRLSTG
jgi:hypothetical protein